MNAEELLVHDRRQGQTTEGVHAGLIYALRVLSFAYVVTLVPIQIYGELTDIQV